VRRRRPRNCSLVLELLDRVEHLGSGVTGELDAHLLGLDGERRAAGELAHDDAREVAHAEGPRARRPRQASDRARVHAALVRESTRPHVGLMGFGEMFAVSATKWLASVSSLRRSRPMDARPS